MKKQLKCKIIHAQPDFYRYIVLDGYEIVSNGVSSSQSWVINDAGGYHTDTKFNEKYGVGNWEVDFSDMYSDESDKIKGKTEPSIIITVSDN